MVARLNPPNEIGVGWVHWNKFFHYCFKNRFYNSAKYFSNAQSLFNELDIILTEEFNGKIITTKNGVSVVCLELETEEDALFFKLKFN